MATKFQNLKFTFFPHLELANPAAPNGGKCPNCPTGMLSFSHFGPRGEEYYSCVKCNFVVKA